MAKEQKRGNREIRKPKTAKAPASAAKLTVATRLAVPIVLPKRKG